MRPRRRSASSGRIPIGRPRPTGGFEHEEAASGRNGELVLIVWPCAMGTGFEVTPDVRQCPRLCLALAALVWLWAPACHREQRENEAKALAALLKQPRPPTILVASVTAGEWQEVRQFYRDRRNQPVWIAGRRLAPAWSDLRAVLERAADDALDPEDYDVTWLRARAEQLKGTLRPRELETAADALETELRATAAALRYARHLARGRLDPTGDDWITVNDGVDTRAIVARALDEGRVRDLTSRLRPPHGEYAALLDLRRTYMDLASAGGWPSVPGTRVVGRGQRDPAIPALRRRLAATGERDRRLDGTRGQAVSASTLLDRTLADALGRFQARHGLKPTGVLDARTRRELNVPVADRLRQIDVNIERWRIAPRALGHRYIRVNVPDYYLALIDGGRTELGMRIIVGEPDHPTPVLSDAMTHVVLNPYWNIPDSIANDEIAPKLVSDPAYLARNDIELVRIADGRVEPIDPSDQDWSQPLDPALRLRQKPGGTNALGLVKFLFPNHASVYLHDTPGNTLFNRTARALSHGCVRVERPLDLALALLPREGWDRERILAAMHSDSEQWVRLQPSVPVHLMYFTAWADGAGNAQFRPDIYDHDRPQAAALGRLLRRRPGSRHAPPPRGRTAGAPVESRTATP
jgi:L,D-transpeptidase YcbB